MEKFRVVVEVGGLELKSEIINDAVKALDAAKELANKGCNSWLCIITCEEEERWDIPLFELRLGEEAVL